MWNLGWRDRAWAQLAHPWDIVIIGGGITGAGILREAARAGLRVLLVEASDFASGTSSRSGKMVHGGLRYLKQGEIRLTLESVHERDRLLREGRGLIVPGGFVLANHAHDSPPAWVFGLGLVAYDLLAMKWRHRHYDAAGIRALIPTLSSSGLLGGYRYFDAVTDDARLVLRVLREAVRDGGVALNYACAEKLLRNAAGQVAGVGLRDGAPEGRGRTVELDARVVINATGVWADDLREQIGQSGRLRKLRGSHLIFSPTRFPLTRAVTFLHPRDRRPLYALPWEGVTLLGTTDRDHGPRAEADPRMSSDEVEYLMDAVRSVFPALELTSRDIQAGFAGLRAVVDTGQADPSKESREFVLWDENGLLTVTGGKLTTFRLMAQQALRAVAGRLPATARLDSHKRVLDRPPHELDRRELPFSTRLRLLGRYGADARALLAVAQPGELTPLEPSHALWAELRFAAREEGVLHLQDLMLRRVRLGLLLPRGGLAPIERIRAIIQPELGWDDARWQQELLAYTRAWSQSYSVPWGQPPGSPPALYAGRGTSGGAK